MSATNALEDWILGLLFTATAIPALAENDATDPATLLWISLHTADPGEAGSQNTSEATYTGYARLSLARSAAGWTVTSGTVSNDSEIAFGQCTASPNTITHVGIGLSETGAGTLLLSDALTSSIVMQVGTTPIFSIGELDITCS